MADVVGKTIFSDGKGKLFFGYYKTDDSVQFVDYKTWKKLSFKDVSKGDTNKERVIKAILKNQKQFNKKVDFNMWAKQKKRTFEETMDWFIQNGWINNINKGGIREGAADVNKAQIPGDIKIKLQKALDVLNGKKLNYQQKLQVLGRVLDSMGIDKGELNKVSQKLRTKLESVNEASLKPKKLTQLKKGEKFVFNNNPYEFVELYTDIPNAAKVKKEDGKTSVVSFGGGVVNKNTKGGFSDYLKQGGRVWDNVNPINSPSINEGKKRFNTMYGVGKAKYVVNYHDGSKKHKDGSDFFDIEIFKNQKDFDKFQKALLQKGFIEESVNESFADPLEGFPQKYKDLLKKLQRSNNLSQMRTLKQKMNIIRKEMGLKPLTIESVNEAKFGYKDSTASYINKHNNEYKIAEKMNKGNEMKFYDDLQKMEDKIGHPKTMLFISNALRGYGVDMYKDPKIKNPADAQEALFLLSK